MKNTFGFTLPLAVNHLLSTVPANAHPGHVSGEVQLSHYLVSPDHLGICLVATVILFCAVCTLSCWRKVSNS